MGLLLLYCYGINIIAGEYHFLGNNYSNEGGVAKGV